MRSGKIGRLPVALQDAVCQRLECGQFGREIAAWLNSLPEVQQVLKEDFGGQAVTRQNVNAWGRSGFERWRQNNEKTERIKNLAAQAMQFAQANRGSIAEGASALASGKILELLETVDAAESVAEFRDVVTSLARLRTADIAQQRNDLGRERVKQKNEELDLARMKYDRETCKLFIKWAQNKRALELANAAMPNEEKLEKMGRLMFGDLWDKAKKREPGTQPPPETNPPNGDAIPPLTE